MEQDEVWRLLRRLRWNIGVGHANDGLKQVASGYERLLEKRERKGSFEEENVERFRNMQSRIDEKEQLYDLLHYSNDLLDRYLASAQHTRELPMHEMLCLLLSLAKDDGMSCSSSDLMQTQVHEFERMGDRLQMSNDQLIRSSQVLFDAHQAPLQDDSHLSSKKRLELNDVSTTLWDERQKDDTYAPIPFGQMETAFFTLAMEQTSEDESQEDSSVSDKSQDAASDSANLMDEPYDAPNIALFDITRKLDQEYNSKVDDDWSCRTSSTSGDEWNAPEKSVNERESARWENVGYRSLNPPRQKLGHPDPLVHTQPSRTDADIVDVYEADLVQDSLLALCGVESLIYRKSRHSASLHLPSRINLRLGSGAVTSLHSALKIFRDAGTLFYRLELFATFYLQDTARGERTLAALSSALLSYLRQCASTVQAMSRHAKEKGYSFSQTLITSRQLCRQLHSLGTCLKLDTQDFWPLLTQRKYHYGLDLLNYLHDQVLLNERSDADGKLSPLIKWLFVKASTPFFEILAEFLSSGGVCDWSDPHNEFELAKWSRRAGEWYQTVPDETAICQLVPSFLSKASLEVIRIGRLQKALMELCEAYRRAVKKSHFTLSLSDGEEIVRENIQVREQLLAYLDGTQVSEADMIMEEGGQSASNTSLEFDDASAQMELLHACTRPIQIDTTTPSVAMEFADGTSHQDQTFIQKIIHDETQKELDLTPLYQTIHRNVERPIRQLATRLDQLTTSLVLKECCIVSHLMRWKKMVLMGDGYCADIFARHLLNGLQSERRGEWVVSSRLTASLYLAMNEAQTDLDGESEESFYFELSSEYAHDLIHSNVSTDLPRLLSHIALQYNCGNKDMLKGILGGENVEQYTQTWRFLLLVRITGLQMKKCWRNFRVAQSDTCSRYTIARDVVQRMCDRVIHDTLRLVTVFQDVYAAEVLYQGWNDLEMGMKSAKTLDELEVVHTTYMHHVQTSCFLRPELKELYDAFTKPLLSALQLAQIIRRAGVRQLNDVKDEILTLSTQHKSAMADVVKIMKAVSDPDLKRITSTMVLQLDFNDYY